MRTLKFRGVHSHVIDEIGQRIVSGEFPPGKGLPSEAQLCTALGVSRTALREALRVLGAKGLVQARQKVGTVVQPIESWNSLDADVLLWRIKGGEAERVIGELYELRHLLEPLAAAVAAERATEADMQVLHKAYEDMVAAGDDGGRLAAPDLRFHRAIIAASGNRLFSALAQVIGAALSVNFQILRDTPRGHAHSMPAHRKVLDAIVDRNPTAARLAMQELIEDSQRDARGMRSVRQLRGTNKKFRKASGCA